MAEDAEGAPAEVDEFEAIKLKYNALKAKVCGGTTEEPKCESGTFDATSVECPGGEYAKYNFKCTKGTNSCQEYQGTICGGQLGNLNTLKTSCQHNAAIAIEVTWLLMGAPSSSTM